MPEQLLAIVTGTSSGIGHELAQQLLASGWEVVGLARREPPIQAPAYSHVTIDIGEVTQHAARLEAHLAPGSAIPR